MVLDLNRDGKVELKNAAFFDLNANGFHEFTRWIDKTDAFLVLDKKAIFPTAASRRSLDRVSVPV